jgi:hypothetical protein
MLTRPSDTPFIDGLNRIEGGVDFDEFAPQPFDMRRDGVVIQNHVCRVHQLLPVLDVAGIAGERVHDPELGQAQRHRCAVPRGLHLLGVDQQGAAPHDLARIVRPAQGVDAPEQGRHPRRQVGQAHILGQKIVGAQAQSGHRVQFAVACRQEDDGQFGR